MPSSQVHTWMWNTMLGDVTDQNRGQLLLVKLEGFFLFQESGQKKKKRD